VTKNDKCGAAPRIHLVLLPESLVVLTECVLIVEGGQSAIPRKTRDVTAAPCRDGALAARASLRTARGSRRR
jgi:hypothetical protein